MIYFMQVSEHKAIWLLTDSNIVVIPFKSQIDCFHPRENNETKPFDRE